MPSAEEFAEYRPLLFAIAYRMLGSVMDAEDVVQDTYLRWQGAATTEVASPRAYLTTIVTRLCLDHLRSARVQREQYIGPWLPEPLVSGPEPEVVEAAALHESLTMAFLVLLESLSPLERAVFLLHDVFGYEFTDVAPIVGKSAAHCRQLARRARAFVAARRPRFEPSRDEQERLTRQFVHAASTGDVPALVATLADDITFWADGGGKAAAARQPIHGAAAVSRLVVGVLRKLPPGLVMRPAWVNGQPAILSYLDGRPFAVLLLEVAEGRVQALRLVANPDKLRHLPPEPTAPAAPAATAAHETSA